MQLTSIPDEIACRAECLAVSITRLEQDAGPEHAGVLSWP